jgi:N-acyl homoserine lactone hydrolase
MKLYLMHLGTVLANDAPIPGYLVQTDDGINVLIDAGYRPGTFGEDLHPERAAFRVHEDDLVINRLAEPGLSPEEIVYVVCSHFDPDHAGYLNAFPRAKIVVQRAHLTAARAQKNPRFEFTRTAWDLPDERYHLVDGDTELLPGIELIETSGHVPGHQSALVRLSETGPVLLTIDVIAQEDEADPATRPASPFDMDDAAARASARKLLDLARRENVRLIVYGHDARQWARLRHSPAYYR